MKDCNITFIGCGNMSRSLIGGLINDGVKKEPLVATDPDAKQRLDITTQFGVTTLESNEEAVDNADIIVLAVKPQVMQQVVSGLAITLKNSSKMLISIAAGVRLASFTKWLDTPIAVVRVMPNTPALIQSGAAALFANEHTSDIQKNNTETVMRSVGTITWLDSEDLMDTVTALSGSGPAYFFYFMESMEKSARAMGLSNEHASLLTIETALGAAKMASLSNFDLSELRKQVTSPGGTTEQAIIKFQQGNLEQLVHEAMNAAKQRAIELSQGFGD